MFGPDCSSGDGSTRWRKRVEARAFSREVGEALAGPPPFDPLVDPVDCAHGCNGACVVSGSERCNFTCHEDLTPREIAVFDRLDQRATEVLASWWAEDWDCPEDAVYDDM
jgi:hypothetical protein